MLGRTANDIFWMARYIERADYMARLLEVGYRIALLPREAEIDNREWQSTLRGAGCEDGFLSKYSAYETSDVIHYLMFDRDNPSSIATCIASARRNARAQRTALTREMWESLNTAYMEFQTFDQARTSANELPNLFDWVKQRSALFRGSMLNTILRNDTYWFTQLGSFIERSDNTARMLDVKYYVLLPQNAIVGGGIDNVQWGAILRSVSAYRSYRWVYRDDYKPWKIGEFLILNKQMPRSLRSCYDFITTSLDDLADLYGEAHSCQELAHGIRDRLATESMDVIFQTGLHEFLQNFIGNNNQLASEISSAYHFTD